MIKKLVILLIVCFINISSALAITEPQKYTILDDFYKAMEKFKGSNVSVAYEEFSQIVNISPKDNDYINIVLTGKLSDIGFYSLANRSRAKIVDFEIAQTPLKNIDEIYYQTSKIEPEDEIYLGECFSDITYNNMSKEIATDLTANYQIREKYDYAEYLIALAWYKSGNLEYANNHINDAIERNPKNVSYKYLYAKILADEGQKDKAFKVAENIKKSVIMTNFYAKKYKEIEEYILYKNTKDEKLKKYHLACYYYYRDDYLRSLKSVPIINDKNNKENSMIYALISQNYVALKEYEKASSNAQKSYRLNKKNPNALLLLGDLAYQKEDYRGALKYYKDAMKYDKTTYYADTKTAKASLKLGRTSKANEILEKVLKNSSDNYEAYYLEALIEKYKELAYLKKSIGLNSEFADGWLELANYERTKANYKLAQLYLNNAYNLDQNNYRYYYYQGLLYKDLKDKENAKYYFQKCKSLNPKFTEVQKELKR